MCFEIYFKKIKLFSLVFIEHRDHFTFLHSLGTYLERKYFIEFNSISYAIPRVDDYDYNIANCVSCVLGVEDRRSMDKELGPILEDLSMSLSLNPFFMNGFEDESFQRMGGWYELENVRNHRAIARSGHKNHG
ncbi:hypothetical protein M9H77_17684 [Catharanthus roseus]|uniref:Uncharacterized protein n=1 Tax=Catharanthus roseus TaxID=4058 RepID=A0ACC0B5A1_CATRO|nr:hypothetical protein M9H77_17684 [Catharanthus roseus]